MEIESSTSYQSFFFTHELLGSYIDVIQFRSSHQLANLFSMLLPITRHKQIVQEIGTKEKIV